MPTAAATAAASGAEAAASDGGGIEGGGDATEAAIDENIGDVKAEIAAEAESLATHFFPSVESSPPPLKNKNTKLWTASQTINCTTPIKAYYCTI